MITLLLLGVGVLALYAYCKIKFRFAEKIPTVEPMRPFFGNGLEFAQKNSYEIFKSLTRAYKDNKRIFKLSFGPYPVICPTHPDLIQKIMTEQASMDKPFVYDFMRVKHGLLTADYDEWRVHRKALNPTFNTRILNSFIPIFTDCVSKMIANMEKHVDDEKPINMLEFTSPCTLEMICRTSLGGTVLEREGKQEFIEGLEIILHNVGLRMFNANLYPDIVYRNTRFYQAEMAARKICYAFTDKVIHEKRTEFEKKLRRTVDGNNNSAIGDENGFVAFDEEEDDMLSYKKPQIFVDQLLTIPNDGKPFTHEEITDHIYTMIAAGNETSATQAAHACLLLAMHPEAQDRAAAEVRELLADDVEYTHDILKQMVYLERIIKESQRLCPVAAVYGRKTIGPIQLDEFHIPTGYVLLLNVFALHRQKEFWGPNAENFDPDHFLPERVKERHPYAYLPFSGGPRGCIGSRYAMMSMKVILSQILKNYRLTTDIPYEKLDFKFKVSMHLSFEHMVKLEPRGENAFYRLRRVFHEFERQNQDSITAILRVLALIDQTLENTIQDCEKVFHLPSLESENVLFREVTRPLLLRVEKLCQQISSKDIASIEATMEEVEMEANVYQRLLGETMSDMRSLQHELDIADRWSLDISVPAKIDALFDQMALVNSTICTEITAAFGSFVDHQRSLGETIGQNMRPEDNDELILAVSNYVTFLQNETTLLVQDIIEDLDDWFNETDVFLNLVAAEAANLPHKLLESPIEEFLLGESSLRCLAEFSNHVTVQRMSQELASILRCFNVSSDTKKPFDMALHLLSQLDSDIQLTLRGILTCQQSASFEGLDIDDYRNIMSCSEVTQSVLEAMENLIDAKLEEIVMHIDASMYFNELQMEILSRSSVLEGVKMFLTAAVVVVLLLLVFYWAQQAERNARFAKDIPGPKLYPIIGSSYLFFGSDERTFDNICALFRKYKRMFKLSLGTNTAICLSDPDLVQQVLTTDACQNKAFFYRFLEMDYGLISARYADWKMYRKMLNPAFNQRILISFISIFSRCSEGMVRRMASEETSQQPFNVLHYTTQCTLEMVCASSLKSDITEDPLAKQACGYLERITAIMGSRVFNVFLYSDLLFSLTQRYREMHKLIVGLSQVVNPILYNRWEEISKQRAETLSDDDEQVYRKPMVFLDQLLHMRRDNHELELQEIEGHLYTIIGAGSETTANQVAYTLLLLAMHSDVQDRVYDEIRDIYGDDSGVEVTYEMLSAQTFLEQVIKESMRLLPVAPLIGRETIEPMKLGGYEIPAGVTLLINILSIHHNKELWGDRADQFDPDRFDPSHYDARKSHPFSFIPFGGGPRNCIGYRYAMLSMKIILTKVLRTYQLFTPLTFSDLSRLSFAITLNIASGHMVQIKRRINQVKGAC
ncbi:uncharacterized protein LOC128721779 [Anopheles nili]|uniref:uncharacterized protein LOC128721779 n=1 Tax=Anopheles nili TaxID=185578 RepID=UPI00237B81AB|nr:uncharacterized protein LOC128721779 [Anopheles nili]